MDPAKVEYRFPSGTDERQQFLDQVGRDGWKLLAAIEADPASQWMLSIPAVDTLQRIWKQDYLPQDSGGTWMAEEDRKDGGQIVLFPLRPGCISGQETINLLDWIQTAFHPNV